MAEERDGGCQPQVRGFLLCLAEAGLHHTVCQEGCQETTGEPKKVQSEMTRILPLLSCWGARRISTRMAPAPVPALPAQGLVMVGVGRGGTHVVICVSMKIRMKTRRAGMAEANIIHIGKVPLLPMG